MNQVYQKGLSAILQEQLSALIFKIQGMLRRMLKSFRRETSSYPTPF